MPLHSKAQCRSAYLNRIAKWRARDVLHDKWKVDLREQPSCILNKHWMLPVRQRLRYAIRLARHACSHRVVIPPDVGYLAVIDVLDVILIECKRVIGLRFPVDTNDVVPSHMISHRRPARLAAEVDQPLTPPSWHHVLPSRCSSAS